MNTEWWDRLETLYGELKDLPERERSTFLDRVGGDDASMQKQLERLLASDVTPVEQIGQALPKIVDDESRTFQDGGSFERYRLVDRLGHGGMGEVFLAVRKDDPSERRVAVKILRGKWGANQEFVRRFQREQSILARLEHPNVARLYDWGTTGDGRPYLAIEYVRGVPIHDYCRSESLSTEDRLRLFRKVCDAVQFAHRNAVIHRDLKPSNILISPAGEPKLLDFGIAKLLDAEGFLGGDTTTLLFLTPQYASPEQFRGEPVSTLSDVYSLGVILYELVTGHHPYPLSEAVRQEVERIICEEEPEKPSTAVTHGSIEGRDPTQVRRSLVGDVDKIVMKALAKSPEGRYSSVEQLSEDIGRHLDGHPVIAQKPTLRYRARKFLRRHRLSVGLASCTAILLLLFAAVLIVEQRKTVRERDRAEALYGFLVETFEQIAPGTARGKQVTVREYLDQASRRLNVELSGQRELQANLQQVIGAIYTRLGLYNQAESFLKNALRSHEEILGAGSVETAETLKEWATLKLRLGALAEAEVAYRRSLRIVRDRLPSTNPAVTDAMNSLAIALVEIYGPNPEAEELILKAFELRQARNEGDNAEVLSSLRTIAWFHEKTGEYEKAEKHHREAVAISRRLFPGDHPDVAGSHQGLGVLLELRGRYSEAESVQRLAADMWRRLVGERHPSTLATMSDLSMSLKALGRYKEAEKLMLETLALRKEVLGAQHPHYAISLMALSTLLEDLSRFGEAEQRAREAVEIWRSVFIDEPDHPTLAMSLNNLAGYLFEQGKYQEAEPIFEEVLTMRLRKLGIDHPEVAATLQNLGDLWTRTGEYEKSRPVLRRSIEIRRLHIRGHPILAHTINSMGNLEHRAGNYKAEEVLRREALEILDTSLPNGHWNVEYARGLLGGSLTGQGRYSEAEGELLRSYEMLVKNLGVDSAYTQGTISRLVRLYELWDQPKKAIEYREQLR